MSRFYSLGSGSDDCDPYQDDDDKIDFHAPVSEISIDSMIDYDIILLFFFQMYGLTWLIDLPSLIDDIDVLILITSAICHDLDHPGYNNAYQVILKT